MVRPFLSVIIPAWNEAERLPLSLIDIDRQLSAVDYSYEILVVNDGSDDHTSSIAKKFSAIIKNFKVIDSPDHRGKGAAMRIGAVAAKGTWRLMMEADNSFTIAEFNRVIPLLAAERGADLIIGSRMHRETRIDPPLPFPRRVVEYFLNLSMRRFFRSEIHDFFIGFQCFSDEAADRIFSMTRSDSWSVAGEAILLAERLQYRILEVPVIGAYAVGSHFRMRDYLHWFRDAIRIWWWLKRQKYPLSNI